MDVLSSDTMSWSMHSEAKTRVVRLDGFHAAASCSPSASPSLPPLPPPSLLITVAVSEDSDPPRPSTWEEDRVMDETGVSVRLVFSDPVSTEKVLYSLVVHPLNVRSGRGSSKYLELEKASMATGPAWRPMTVPYAQYVQYGILVSQQEASAKALR